jgi:hypothetical protein
MHPLSVWRQTTMFRLAAGLGALLVLSYGVMLAGWREEAARRAVVGNWLLVAGGLLAVACLAWAARAAGAAAPRTRLAWSLLAAAQLALVLGDFIWMMAELGGQRTGTIPLADGLYALFYPLAIAALLYLPALPLSRAAAIWPR